MDAHQLASSHHDDCQQDMFIGFEIQRESASPTRQEHPNESFLRLACNIFSNNDLSLN